MSDIVRGILSWPIDYEFTNSDTKKWLQFAKTVKEFESPCFSRQIGVVIVDPKTNSLVSTGHNGPPESCPKNDNYFYLRDVVWNKLTEEERKESKTENSIEFAENYSDKSLCPRKVVNAPSGCRLELCSCIHGESDAIVRAGRSVAGCYMFCYCGVPCIECTKLIINSGIKTVVAIDGKTPDQDYSPYSSRWLFEKSKVKLILVEESWINL